MTAHGATFGKYFLAEKIATGGMAEIHLAKLLGPGGFEKQLVLKLIHPELSSQRQFVEMFVAEAKTLVSLTHGNIVPVYELGVVDGTYFLAMEYIDGPALAALQVEVEEAGEHFSPAIATYICAELLKGLDYAHRKGESVIHRDISPRNVMLSREGEVKLVDFGLAITELSQSGRKSSSSLPAGSFPYMSPEQVRQETLDGRTDLFSAGVILWELLTGQHLFHRDTADDTLEAVLSAPIAPPSSVRPELPPALDKICAKALAREREDRYPTASAFLSDVNRYLYSLAAPSSPAEIAQLVARRAPARSTARDASRPDEGTPNDQKIDRTVPMAERQAKGNQTAPMPRVRGKRLTKTATFATHAAFDEVLAKATPLFPIQAIDALEEDVAKATRARSNQGKQASTAETAATAEPSGNWPVRILGLLALLGAGVGIGLLLSSSPGTSGLDAGVALDAAIATAAIDASLPVDATTAALDAAPIDAGRVADARRKRPIDAAPKGHGTLRIGAKPWGEVYVDGKKLGQAPGQWRLAAGKHRVEVRYPVPGKEQKRRFRVVIVANETKSLGVVDFTKP